MFERYAIRSAFSGEKLTANITTERASKRGQNGAERYGLAQIGKVPVKLDAGSHFSWGHIGTASEQDEDERGEDVAPEDSCRRAYGSEMEFEQEDGP